MLCLFVLAVASIALLCTAGWALQADPRAGPGGLCGQQEAGRVQPRGWMDPGPPCARVCDANYTRRASVLLGTVSLLRILETARILEPNGVPRDRSVQPTHHRLTGGGRKVQRETATPLSPWSSCVPGPVGRGLRRWLRHRPGLGDQDTAVGCRCWEGARWRDEASGKVVSTSLESETRGGGCSCARTPSHPVPSSAL